MNPYTVLKIDENCHRKGTFKPMLFSLLVICLMTFSREKKEIKQMEQMTAKKIQML